MTQEMLVMRISGTPSEIACSKYRTYQSEAAQDGRDR
jgi:hypothetical protein